MNKVKVFYLVLKISYYDDEYCCNCSLACDGIDSILTEEITY